MGKKQEHFHKECLARSQGTRFTSPLAVISVLTQDSPGNSDPMPVQQLEQMCKCIPSCHQP